MVFFFFRFFIIYQSKNRDVFSVMFWKNVMFLAWCFGKKRDAFGVMFWKKRDVFSVMFWKNVMFWKKPWFFDVSFGKKRDIIDVLWKENVTFLTWKSWCFWYDDLHNNEIFRLIQLDWNDVFDKKLNFLFLWITTSVNSLSKVSQENMTNFDLIQWWLLCEK